MQYQKAPFEISTRRVLGWFPRWMSKVFRPWKTDEFWLLPPSVADFVPSGHPAHLVRDLVSEEFDLSAIMGVYTEV